MSRIIWDKTGERFYQTGVDRGVLYPQDSSGAYPKGVPWNGLTNVTGSPEGAEPNDIWADNIKYGSIRSTETFKGTIEAYTYPDEFNACDGNAEVGEGVYIGQQDRAAFGFAYRTMIGNDVASAEEMYKITLVYGCTASPTEISNETINDSPEPAAMSWEFDTVPVAVTGHKPSATLTIDSRKIDPLKLKAIEDIIYGKDEVEPSEPRLPLPDEIIALLAEE